MCRLGKVEILILFLPLLHSCNSANILALFPMASSHDVIGHALSRELALRGHNVTMVSPYPYKSKGEGLYEQISLSGLHTKLLGEKEKLFELDEMSAFEQLVLCYNIGYLVTEYTLQNKDIVSLLHSNRSYDLVILDHFFSEALLGVAHHYNAPVILASSLEDPTWTHYMVGNPEVWSYMPNSYLQAITPLTFFQRVQNVVLNMKNELYRRLVALPYNNQLLQKYFPNAPNLYELIHNISMVFVNSHPSFSHVSAHLPNMIQIGGMHIEENGTIPKHIETILDNATDGAIYFSMGSNLLSRTIPQEKLEAILRAFEGMNETIIWKFEEENLPNKPKNLHIFKWLPQQAILAHRNVKLFISHCGLMSVIEATHFGVPMLAIPIYADQKMNAKIVVRNGYAVEVPYKEISERKLRQAVRGLIENDSYRKNAKHYSQLLRDRPISPMGESIFWTEYVLRQRGAPHLRSPALDLQWYQLMSLDVAVFLITTSLAFLWLLKTLWEFLIFKLNLSKCDKVKLS